MDTIIIMDILKKSWNNIPESISKEYLDGYGSPSISSRNLLIDLIQNISKKQSLKLIDVGCGNGNLLKYLKQNSINISYTGVDFSQPLIEAAKMLYPLENFILDDVSELSKIEDKFDIAVYSHVIEMLPSPEKALFQISNIAKTIIIRFFEPPEFEFDEVEIRTMNFGEENLPYLRRKMSKNYYQLILSKIGIKEVHVYNDLNSKDQIHILYR